MLQLLALATLAVVPSVNFTADSVYTDNKILSLEVEEIYEEESLISKTLHFNENEIVGYSIYDDPETEYIDGLKLDGEFVYAWSVENYDDSIEHTISIKTVYSDDIYGILLAKANEKAESILKSPYVIVLLALYGLAAIVLIIGGFCLIRAKKVKVKTAEDIADEVHKEAIELHKDSMVYLDVTVKDLYDKLNKQNHAIIEALVLMQANDAESKISAIKLLKSVSEIEPVSAKVIESINEIKAAKEKARQEAIDTLNKIAKGEKPDSKSDLGGLSV